MEDGLIVAKSVRMFGLKVYRGENRSLVINEWAINLLTRKNDNVLIYQTPNGNG